MSAAHSFDEMTLFEPLYNGEDILNGKHANTTIPKIIGAINRYTVTGEEYYLQVAANFWQIVVENHTYITGGNSEWEHFGEPKILDAERTSCNCETCNTYKSAQLTQILTFAIIFIDEPSLISFSKSAVTCKASILITVG